MGTAKRAPETQEPEETAPGVDQWTSGTLRVGIGETEDGRKVAVLLAGDFNIQIEPDQLRAVIDGLTHVYLQLKGIAVPNGKIHPA